MTATTLYSTVYQLSVFGVVACSVTYCFALIHPKLEKYFRRMAEGVTTAVGVVLLYALVILCYTS
jgi:hypothetical protein